ncbi:MAG: TetR/AcrR family transcriptional regulator [Meiothermus sp.]|nr:TetR/AcrR family transcriptional regulator [Meiothermus sp.]
MTKDSYQQKREDLRREQILAAAIQVFSERGFQVAKMQEVANAAGISNGTVYNYFRSKDELLLALLAQLAEREQRAEQMEQIKAGDLETVMVAQLQRRFKALQAQKELWRVVLPELITNPALRERGFQEIFGPIFELGENTFVGMAGAGKLRDLEASHMIRAMAGSVLGVFVLSLLGDETTDLESDAILTLLGQTFAAAFAGGNKPKK